MSIFNQDLYNTLKKEFEDAAKTISNYKAGTRQLPANQTEREQRIIKYRDRLITAYNNFIVYLSEFYGKFDLESQFQANEKIVNYDLKLKKSLQILSLRVTKKIE